MFAQVRFTTLVIRAVLLALLAFAGQPAGAQTDDPANGEIDPIKLFERGQDAHAKGDTKLALQLYEAALKIKPEFPEAEFQRAMVLVITNKEGDALEGFKRAVATRSEWGLAYSKFGSQLAFGGKYDREAEPILRRALELNDKDLTALTSLAEVRNRQGDSKEALKLITAATLLKDADSATWRRRFYIELGAGENKAALATIDHLIELRPADPDYRFQRVALLIKLNDRLAALARLYEMRTALGTNVTWLEAVTMARLYAQAGKPDVSLRLLDGIKEADRKQPEVIALRSELTDDSALTDQDRASLEESLKSDPKNAGLLARLGNAYRRVDAQKSQDYYYRALQLDPKNEKYAVGYGAALVQLRQFTQAENILRQVVVANPDNYTAHANLALALFEMKRFADAVPEYDWLATAKPDLAVTYFFMAIAHDNLGEYQPALDAYQKFLARADAVNNKLEIDKVNLRLPTLREQIRRGEGAKRKNP